MAEQATVGSEDISTVKSQIRCHEGLFLTPDLLLDTHKLPQLVKVTYAECEAPGLSKNEILLLHFTYTSKKVMAQSLSREGGVVVGPELNIPLAYPGRFELLQNQSSVKVFECLDEVVKEDFYSKMPVVRLLVEEDILLSELPSPECASPEMDSASLYPKLFTCKKGDVITILSAQPIEPQVPRQVQEIPELQKKGLGQKLKGKLKGKGKKYAQLENKEAEEPGPKMLFTCSNQDGEMVTLPGTLKGRFTLKPLEFESGTTYTVENIIDNFKLPQDVRLVHGDCPGEEDEFTGYVRLFHTYRDEVIVGTSVQDDGQISQVEFSINTDIQFCPADLTLPENKDILRLFQSNVRTSVLVDSKNMDSFILVMGKPYSSIYQDRTKLFKNSDLATYEKKEIAPVNPIYEETPDEYQDPDLFRPLVPSAPPLEGSSTVEYYSPVEFEPSHERDDALEHVQLIKPEVKPRKGKSPASPVAVGLMSELKKAQESKKPKPPIVPPRPKGVLTPAKAKNSDQDTSDDYTELIEGNYTTLKPITESTVEGPNTFTAFENTVYDSITPAEDQSAIEKRGSASVRDLVKQLESVDKRGQSVSYKTQPLNLPIELPKEPQEEEENYSKVPSEAIGEVIYQSPPPAILAPSPNEPKSHDDTRVSPMNPTDRAMLPTPSHKFPVSFDEDSDEDAEYDEIAAVTSPVVRNEHRDTSAWVPPDDLSTLSVSEVTACLRHLNLGNDVIAAFEREMIDGSLLNDIDETIMTQDMNLRKLDALKILKFIKGWRP